jgi:DUF971 family protein
MNAADTPVEVIHHRDGSRLEIVWGDGHRSDYPALELRLRCPCAECLSGGEARLRPAPEPDVGVASVDPFGRYAVSIRFSDGHSAGVYRWEYLRYWCPCDPCWNRRQREAGYASPDEVQTAHELASCSPPSAAPTGQQPRPQPLTFKRS